MMMRKITHQVDFRGVNFLAKVIQAETLSWFSGVFYVLVLYWAWRPAASCLQRWNSTC